MVEGKLQSWGRAQTVIKILEDEVVKGDIEASLEDVVDAVKNYGNKKDSLKYLQQECQCCYSTFPMSKVSLFCITCTVEPHLSGPFTYPDLTYPDYSLIRTPV